jgi:hypothetical protein
MADDTMHHQLLRRSRPEDVVVPRYRCFCLTEDDRVAWGLHLDAASLGTAIEAAHRACREHLHTSTSRVEIWLEAERLYVGTETTNSS